MQKNVYLCTQFVCKCANMTVMNNIKHLFILTLCALCILPTFAAKDKNKDIQRISITYDYVSDNPNETPEAAKQTALERAKQKAMEENFGVDISSVKSMVHKSKTGDGEASASTQVLNLSDVSVRGEWVETIKEKVLEQSFVNGLWHVKVFVEGKARKHMAEKADIQYVLLNDTSDRHHRDTYYDGDLIYLRFKTPVDGALCVYLVDELNDVMCLLPYEGSTKGFQPVKADKDYLFFDENPDQFDFEGYRLLTQAGTIQNTIYIIFTPNRITKASDKASDKNWRGDLVPRSLSYVDFINWLARNQLQDEQLVVRKEVITIHPNKN